MSDKPVNVGLSGAQASELMMLRREYHARIGTNVADRAVWLGNHLSNYLSALSLAAEVENPETKSAQPRAVPPALPGFDASVSQLSRPVAGRDSLREELGDVRD